MNLFPKKLIWFLLISLIFPAYIFAQEPEGVLLTGLFTDSTDIHEQEILDQGVAKGFNLQTVWTYDKTNIINGPLEILATAKVITSSSNGLQEPLLSEISGYQKKVITHSAGTRTAVTLAKQGILWGDELYLVSPALISQSELRQIRDLTSQGKGFNKIVLYTGDDMIPDFKEASINFSNYTVNVKLSEDSEILLTKVVYEDRGTKIDVLERFLSDFATRAKEQLGKEPLTVSINGNITGNKFTIEWKDGTTEIFYLQSDSITGQAFFDEPGIEVIPIFVDLPHGRDQLVILKKFYNEYRRMPGKEDIEYFKQQPAQEIPKEINTARDPNELLVSPEGDISPGERLNYTINYENEGSGIAFGVYITDTLEEDLDVSTLSVNNNGVYDSTTRTIKWFIGELGSKQKGSVSFSVSVNSYLQDKQEVINFATVYFPSVPEVTRTNGTVNRITRATDTTPPITLVSVSPSPNQAGWNNTEVTVTLSATDNEGGLGVAKTEYSVDGTNWLIYTNAFTISDEGITKVYYRSTDNANNIEIIKSLEIKIDKTPPLITAQASPVSNANGWNNTAVTVSFTANDALSGIATVTGPVSAGIEGANQNIGGETVDLAGNKATSNVSVNIDMTPPQVVISAPVQGAEYLLNANISAAWSATDTLSGIDSTTGTVSMGSVINTASVGEKSFSVVAMDKAGNRIEVPITYNVRYSYGGILPPINPDGSSVFKLGRIVPVKFQLRDGLGNYISMAAARIYLNKISDNVVGNEIEAESVGEANIGNLFRYDSIDNQYIFNLGTNGLSVGTWKIRVSIDDGSSYYVVISLK